jgi:hypothetical protein
MGLAMGMEHPVEAALRADMEALVRQGWHDLPRRQCCEFRLVAGEQDPLALLVAEAVRNKAVAAFAAVQAVPITRKLPPPALQGAESDPKQSGHLTGPCPGGHGAIENLQGLAAITGRRQSPASSPQ